MKIFSVILAMLPLFAIGQFQDFQIYPSFDGREDSSSRFDAIVIDYSEAGTARFYDVRGLLKISLREGNVFEVRVRSGRYMSSRAYIHVGKSGEAPVAIEMKLLTRSDYSVNERCEGVIYYSRDFSQWMIYDSSSEAFIDR